MRTPAPYWIPTIILLISTQLSACSSTLTRKPDITRIDPKTGEIQTKSDVKEIEAGILTAFPDIPFPANHEINLERSVIFTSSSQKVGRVSTEGKGDVNSLYAFYQSKMAENGWKMVNAFQAATSSLYFTKPGKFAAIIIEATGRNSSRVTLNVGPE